MVNTSGLELVPEERPTTCLISVDRTMNNLVSPPVLAKPQAMKSGALEISKRLGRGVVDSGLTCECGVFAAMACGEWPTQRVSLSLAVCLP